MADLTREEIIKSLGLNDIFPTDKAKEIKTVYFNGHPYDYNPNKSAHSFEELKGFAAEILRDPKVAYAEHLNKTTPFEQKALAMENYVNYEKHLVMKYRGAPELQGPLGFDIPANEIMKIEGKNIRISAEEAKQKDRVWERATDDGMSKLMVEKGSDKKLGIEEQQVVTKLIDKSDEKLREQKIDKSAELNGKPDHGVHKMNPQMGSAREFNR